MSVTILEFFLGAFGQTVLFVGFIGVIVLVLEIDFFTGVSGQTVLFVGFLGVVIGLLGKSIIFFFSKTGLTIEHFLESY